MEFCDKFYVWADIYEGQFCATLHTIKNQDIKKSKMLGQNTGIVESPYILKTYIFDGAWHQICFP